jgi:thiopeptide-type bacteriocin biosynthesis protein
MSAADDVVLTAFGVPTYLRSAISAGYVPSVPPERIVVRDIYEPEISAFGVEGIKIAEELFQASSEVALAVLDLEERGVSSRLDIAPLLMESVAEAFVPETDPCLLWNAYAKYWTYIVTGEVRKRELSSRLAHLAIRSPVVRRKQLKTLENDQLLDGWAKALSFAAKRFTAAGDVAPRRRSDLSFHFMHLMNNRLGVLPIQEALLANALKGLQEQTPL